MDLKQFLRYQISGSIFIIWLLLFHFSIHSSSFTDMAKQITDGVPLATFLVGLPLGAIIHQISVTIKNQFFGSLCGLEYLSDSPMKDPTKLLLSKYKDCDSGKDEYLSYIQEKITNLNSFFYVRFDNGFLAPLLAYFTFLVFNDFVLWKYFLSYIIFCLIFIFILFFISRFILLLGILLIYTGNYTAGIIAPDYLIPSINQSSIILNTKELFEHGRYEVLHSYVFESKTSSESEVEFIKKNVLSPSNIDGLNSSQLESIQIIRHNNKESSDSGVDILSRYKTATSLNESRAIDQNILLLSESVESNGLRATNILSLSQLSESNSLNFKNDSEKVQTVKDINGKINDRNKIEISEAKITKIDPSLLNKIIILCLSIAILLLSYIPRIYQELKEYNDLLNLSDTDK